MSIDFAPRLDLVLKALSLSRGQLAAELGVDKSVVSRWMAGVHPPSGHNLARLTQLISRRAEGFSMLDWERDLDDLADRLGASPPGGGGAPELVMTDFLPVGVLEEAVTTTRLRGGAYEGFWRSTRPANDPPGQFMHDQIMIWQGEHGLLRYRMGVYDMRFEGWIVPIQTQLFSVASDPVTGVFLFGIFNAVLRNRAEVLDGITLTCQRNAGGTPVAAGCLMERTGELSGDLAQDEARFRELTQRDPLAPVHTVPKHIRDHLYHDVGPGPAAVGGDPLLVMAFARSMSRGPLSGLQRAVNDATLAPGRAEQR